MSELDSDTWSKLMSFEVTVYKIQVWILHKSYMIIVIALCKFV